MSINSSQTGPFWWLKTTLKTTKPRSGAFRKAKLANPIEHCEDGDEALEYLFARAEDTGPVSKRLPGLILLDLNLPGTDGREVLEKIKAHKQLKKNSGHCSDHFKRQPGY